MSRQARRPVTTEAIRQYVIILGHAIASRTRTFAWYLNDNRCTSCGQPILPTDAGVLEFCTLVGGSPAADAACHLDCRPGGITWLDEAWADIVRWWNAELRKIRYTVYVRSEQEYDLLHTCPPAERARLILWAISQSEARWGTTDAADPEQERMARS